MSTQNPPLHLAKKMQSQCLNSIYLLLQASALTSDWLGMLNFRGSLVIWSFYWPLMFRHKCSLHPFTAPQHIPSVICPQGTLVCLTYVLNHAFCWNVSSVCPSSSLGSQAYDGNSGLSVLSPRSPPPHWALFRHICGKRKHHKVVIPEPLLGDSWDHQDQGRANCTTRKENRNSRMK